MKHVLAGALLLSLTSLLSCSSGQEVTNFWRNPKLAGANPATNVFIVALTQDRAVRNTLESDLAAAASAIGVKSVRSTDVFPVAVSKDTKISKDDFLAKIREMNCDAIFTLSLLDVKSEQRYVPGTTTYAPAYSPYPHYPYYGSFYGYYSWSYPVVTEPGYYKTDKTYFIEGNLYDAATEQIRWSMQSTAYNPTNLSSFSKDYARLLVGELEKQMKRQ